MNYCIFVLLLIVLSEFGVKYNSELSSTALLDEIHSSSSKREEPLTFTVHSPVVNKLQISPNPSPTTPKISKALTPMKSLSSPKHSSKSQVTSEELSMGFGLPSNSYELARQHSWDSQKSALLQAKI
uniref:Uncharacterized protein n=1 Tax=Meloidogyne hapla TaxID=6305 RepID=A0A1I8B9W4_MELHA